MIICGDDDRWKSETGNPGRQAAEACAKEIGAAVVLPVFKRDEGRPTDFNDLHRMEGLEETRRQLMAPMNTYTIDAQNWLVTADMFDKPAGSKAGSCGRHLSSRFGYPAGLAWRHRQVDEAA